MTHSRAVRTTAGVLLALSLIAAPTAMAKKDRVRKEKKAKPAATKMFFKLDSHEVMAGEAVGGTVKVFERSGHKWQPFAGAVLKVMVDKQEVGSVTTGEDGTATVSHVVGDDDHVMKVVFAGDASHKKAKRAQGFDLTEPTATPVTTTSRSTRARRSKAEI